MRRIKDDNIDNTEEKKSSEKKTAKTKKASSSARKTAKKTSSSKASKVPSDEDISNIVFAKRSPTIPYAIDMHPRRDEIIRDILDGRKSRKSIVREYGLSHENVVRNYMKSKLIAPIAEKNLDSRDRSAAILQQKLDDIQQYLDKLIQSCDDFLTDPRDSSKYFMGNRADELVVVYEKSEELADGKVIRKRYTEDLQTLIDIALDPDSCNVLQIRSTRTDIRKLILEALSIAQKQVELIGRITGQMQDILIHADVKSIIVPKLCQAVAEVTEESKPSEFKSGIMSELKRLIAEEEASR